MRGMKGMPPLQVTQSPSGKQRPAGRAVLLLNAAAMQAGSSWGCAKATRKGREGMSHHSSRKRNYGRQVREWQMRR